MEIGWIVMLFLSFACICWRAIDELSWWPHRWVVRRGTSTPVYGSALQHLLALEALGSLQWFP